jgi:hypothetical protein
LIYTLVRNTKAQHVVEIGTYDGGTSELICHALHENGSGILNTVAPFEAESVFQIFESWPQALRQHLDFYLMTSMDFCYRLNARGIRQEIGFIDGDHSYQAAPFRYPVAGEIVGATRVPAGRRRIAAGTLLRGDGFPATQSGLDAMQRPQSELGRSEQGHRPRAHERSGNRP